MKSWITPNTIILFVFAIALVHLHAGIGKPAHKNSMGILKNSKPLQGNTMIEAATCDSTKWNHVYDPGRLQVLNHCKTVTGTIVERNADEDGDEHMLLQLDKGQNGLLLKKNYSKKEGCLVVEVVCVNNITRKRAIGACNGYVNNVHLPRVGDHVQVSGSYVVDSHNGWAEIHPASRIEKIK